jgi:hypothetical protein
MDIYPEAHVSHEKKSRPMKEPISATSDRTVRGSVT